MKPAAHIFDFDGVVVDSISMHLKAWDAAVSIIFNQSIEDGLRKSLIGMSTKEISELLAKNFHAPQVSGKLGTLKKEVLAENKSSVPFLPGALDAFAQLHKLGTPFGIASNATLEFIQKALAGAGASVPVVIGIENSGRPKPHPDPFLACARLLGIEFTRHDQCIVFEDSKHGLTAARAAGMLPIGLETQHDAAYLKSFGARATCLHLRDAIDRGWLTALPQL